MSNPYLALRDRLLAVLVDARGADGSLGPDATEKSIPVGRFRRATDGAPLRDPDYPPGAFDRAVRVDWAAEREDEGGNNPLSSPHYFVARIIVTHGIAYGTALAGLAATASGETASTVVLQPQERALMDARRIRRALECPDLIRDVSDSDPVPLCCTREGDTTLEDLGNGRLIVQTVLDYRYAISNVNDDDP